MNNLTKLILVSSALVPLTTTAQSVGAPLNLPYESVFKHYQLHADVPLRDWKVSNETVRKAGGWREYLKQSQTPDTPAASATDHSKQIPQTLEVKKP